MSKSRDAKTAVMAGALVVTGVCEFLEGLEEGVDLLTSAKRAVEKTKERGAAMREAGKIMRRRKAKKVKP